jgi:polysaccharide biosynthesis transport protein
MFDTQEIRAAAPVDSAGALPMPAVSSAQSVHLLDRLNAVFKHRRVAGTAFLLVVTAMMVQTYSTIPIYQTSASIQIDDERSTSVSNLGVNDPTWWQESGPYYRTQYQILQSRELARRVVRRLHLEDHPDFNGNAPKPRDPITLIRQARASASA